MIGWWRRRRFADVIARQLALFAADHAATIERARGALANYDAAVDEADGVDAYGAFEDLCEDLEDALTGMRDSWASNLEPPLDARYRSAFDHAALRAWRDVLPGLTHRPFEPRRTSDGPDDDLPPLEPRER